MKTGDRPTLADARQLLPDAVFLVVETGTKKPVGTKWQKTTFANTQKPGYQRRLASADTIGVLLGPPSNWLSDLDCDTEAYLQFMLAHNEALRHTLQTRGARAGGIWFRNLDHTLDGIYPLKVSPDSPLAKGGKIEKDGLVKIGELRCGRGQSIICGLHPEGIDYRWPIVQAPIELDPRTLTWPEEVRSQLPWNKRRKQGTSEKIPKTGKKNAAGSVTGAVDDLAATVTPGISGNSEGTGKADKMLLEEAKALLPIYPTLWRHFGFPEPAANPTNSPFRTDDRPSFSIFEDGRQAYDHALQQHYDSFDFYQAVTGQTAHYSFVPFVRLAGLGDRLRGRKSGPRPEAGEKSSLSSGAAETASDSETASDWIGRVLTRLDAYFEAGCYWAKDNREIWIPLTVADIKRRLKDFGYSSNIEENQTISQVDRIILGIQVRRAVDYVDSLAGYHSGIYQQEGKRILVKDSPKLIKPKAGQFPVIEKFLLRLFGSEQIKFVYGWIKIALECLYTQQFRCGQAIALAGPRDCGKNFFQDHILTLLFGGRSAKPYRYMLGLTPFNGDLFSAEHLVIEDEAPSTDLRTRHKFGAEIKTIAANQKQSCHHKFRGALTLLPFWRLSISLNDEPDNILILAPLDESLKDKLSIFKVDYAPMPMKTADLREWRLYADTVTAELPAFAWYLLNNWSIEPGLVSQRYGVMGFQHPEIVAVLYELGPEAQMLELIQQSTIFVTQQWVNRRVRISIKEHWTGSASELKKELTACGSRVMTAARKLLHSSNICGVYLNRLQSLYPAEFQFKRTTADRVWILYNRGILERK
jgi:hypothetical protein